MRSYGVNWTHIVCVSEETWVQQLLLCFPRLKTWLLLQLCDLALSCLPQGMLSPGNGFPPQVESKSRWDVVCMLTSVPSSHEMIFLSVVPKPEASSATIAVDFLQCCCTFNLCKALRSVSHIMSSLGGLCNLPDLKILISNVHSRVPSIVMGPFGWAASPSQHPLHPEKMLQGHYFLSTDRAVGAGVGQLSQIHCRLYPSLSFINFPFQPSSKRHRLW